MKYLIRNLRDFIIAIGVLAFVLITVIWCVYSIFTNQFDVKNFVALIGDVFALLGCYFNMPTSAVNRSYTDRMRMEKAFLNGKLDGENFFDDPVDFVEEEVDDDVDDLEEGDE